MYMRYSWLNHRKQNENEEAPAKYAMIIIIIIIILSGWNEMRINKNAEHDLPQHTKQRMSTRNLYVGKR